MKKVILLGSLLLGTAASGDWRNVYHNHKEEKFVIGSHSAGAGMFSALSGVLNNLAWCERHGKTPVVYWGQEGWVPSRAPLQTCEAPYYQQEGYNGSTNVWEYYFEPVSHEKYIPGDQIICGYCVPDEDLVPMGHTETIPVLVNRERRKKIKQYLDKYVKVKSSVMQKANIFYETHIKGRKTIAIHLRGTDKIREMARAKTEDICQVANEYAAKHPGCQFFVCTDELSLLTMAQELLHGKVVTYDACRSVNGKPLHLDHSHNQSPAKIGEDVIIEVLLMSRCSLFIHEWNNVAIGVMYFNPSLDTVLMLPGSKPDPTCINWPS